MSSLKAAACRFFLISRIYSITASVIIISTIIMSCIVTGLATLDDKSGKHQNGTTIAALSATSAALLAINKAFEPAQAAERCRTISRDLNRLDKDFTTGVIDEAKKNQRYARIQRAVPAGTCIWLR